MSRSQANLLLLVAAFIWGVSFIAQKTAMDNIGPYTFIAIRFAISMLVIAPFCFRDLFRADLVRTVRGRLQMVVLCLAFIAGVVFQQIGIMDTTVSNAGFLTSLYVVMIVFIAWAVFRSPPQWIVFLTAPLCVFGVWLIGDASFSKLSTGDLFVIVCAFFFALHAVMIGLVLINFSSPLVLAFIQYGACFLAALVIALFLEEWNLAAILQAGPELLFAGVLSGGVAYTFQVIAQQHTSPSDAGVLLSCEALFAALAGLMVMGDVLSALNWMGCGVIMVAVLATILYPDRKFNVKEA